ncbi:MAG TPA: hypothetical protein VEK73_07800 [Xanthobacteraceae bacterium]|nr:hypothetical protein [Xanthobacteraceae bacterium]
MAAVVAGAIALGGADRASAVPVPSSTAAVRAAAPDHVAAVGYYDRGYGGWINGPWAVGAPAGSAVSQFYGASYYPPYVYYAPPVYYTPPVYVGPAIVYGRPLVPPDPYYPVLYPYVRSTYDGYPGY